MFESFTMKLKNCQKRQEMHNSDAKNIPKLFSLELELVTDGVGVATVDSAVDFIGAKTNCKEKVLFN